MWDNKLVSAYIISTKLKHTIVVALGIIITDHTIEI